MPDGSQYQVGACFERANNLPGAAFNKFFYAKSVTGLMPKPIYEASANMLPSGRTPQRVITGFDVAPKIESEPDVDSLAWRRAWQNGMYSIATPIAGVKDWEYHPREVGEAPPAYVDTVNFEITDGGDPWWFTGLRQSDLELKIENRKLVGISESMVGCLASSTSAAAGAGATYTKKPVIVGIWGEGVVTPIKVKIVAVASGGYDGYMQCTSGADAYGGPNLPIKFDRYEPVIFASGAFGGTDINNGLWVLFPSDGGALAVADEFTFTPTRTLALPSFSARDPLSASSFTVSVDGNVYGGRPNSPGFSSATLKVSFPKEPNLAGGLWAHTQRRKDDPMLTLKVSRDRDDRVLLDKCQRGKRVAVNLYIYGNPIVPGYTERWGFEMATMQPIDVVRDINKRGALPEDADLVAVGLTGPIYVEKLRCTVPAI